MRFSCLERRLGSGAGNPIERIVRDADVALLHMILAPTHLDIRGRLLLGLGAGTPVV